MGILTRYFLIVVGLFGSAFLHAQVPQEATGLGLELMQSQYLTTGTYEYQQNDYTDSKISYRSSGVLGPSKLAEYALDLNLVLPFAEGAGSGFYFPEGYLSVETLPGVTATIGRKLFLWSELDRRLKLGLWEPLFRWDHARPISQGLIGAFVEIKKPRFEILAFASPVFLPDQQPDVEEVDGQFQSASRWFRAPISVLEFQNTEIDLRYDLKRPKTEDVIDNTSFAFSTLLKGETEYGTWVRASVAQKPMNQIHIAINTKDAFNVNSSQFTAPVYPIVVQHRLVTGEFGVNEEDYRVTLSFTQEQFEAPNVPQKWEQTELSDSNYRAAILEYMPLRLRGLPTWISAGYLERRKADQDSGATRIEGDVSASTQRLSFEKWVFAGLAIPMRVGGRGYFAQKLTYYHSPNDEADWLAGELEYKPNMQTAYYVSFDVFGTGQEESASPSFISIYRNNDRVQAGVRYVF